MPHKICPKCNRDQIGVRTLRCPSCDFEFRKPNPYKKVQKTNANNNNNTNNTNNNVVQQTDKSPAIQTSPKKGYKQCPACKIYVAARCHSCIHCNKQFEKIHVLKKHTAKKYTKVNWRELQRGDLIKAKGGPFWITDEKYSHEGISYRVKMGSEGIYKVLEVDKEGIHAIHKKSGVREYLYMGEKRTSKYGTRMKEHRIVKISTQKI